MRPLMLCTSSLKLFFFVFNISGVFLTNKRVHLSITTGLYLDEGTETTKADPGSRYYIFIVDQLIARPVSACLAQSCDHD